jgi:hypothetical protein
MTVTVQSLHPVHTISHMKINPNSLYTNTHTFLKNSVPIPNSK